MVSDIKTLKSISATLRVGFIYIYTEREREREREREIERERKRESVCVCVIFLLKTENFLLKVKMAVLTVVNKKEGNT